MNTINTQLLAMLVDNGLSPVMIDNKDSNMYVGYCSPDCTGINDAKWLIKRIYTDSDRGTQEISLANGVRTMNQKWSEREKLTYKPTPVWK